MIRTHAYYRDVLAPSPSLLRQTFYLRIIELDKKLRKGQNTTNVAKTCFSVIYWCRIANKHHRDFKDRVRQKEILHG